MSGADQVVLNWGEVRVTWVGGDGWAGHRGGKKAGLGQVQVTFEIEMPKAMGGLPVSCLISRKALPLPPEYRCLWTLYQCLSGSLEESFGPNHKSLVKRGALKHGVSFPLTLGLVQMAGRALEQEEGWVEGEDSLGGSAPGPRAFPVL